MKTGGPPGQEARCLLDTELMSDDGLNVCLCVYIYQHIYIQAFTARGHILAGASINFQCVRVEGGVRGWWGVGVERSEKKERVEIT